MNASRTLTVFATAGLCNRLRVLLSGMALAEASGRTFAMIWPRTRACGAAFRELFTNDWPVIDVDRPDPSLQAAYVPGFSEQKFEDFLVAEKPHIVCGTTSWLIFPDRFPAHQPLAIRCAELVEQLVPGAAVADRVAAFRARRFRSCMVGVHVRRGDFARRRPDQSGNTAEIVAAVDRFLAEMPDAGILLCTDDGAPGLGGERPRPEGLRGIFRARYGDRLVETAPSCLDRRVPESIQDALVDLLLLRATDAFVGSVGSSFSEIAILGRAVPSVHVGGPTPLHRWVDRVARVTGVSWLVRCIVRGVYGQDAPFAVAGGILYGSLRRQIVRLRRQIVRLRRQVVRLTGIGRIRRAWKARRF